MAHRIVALETYLAVILKENAQIQTKLAEMEAFCLEIEQVQPDIKTVLKDNAVMQQSLENITHMIRYGTDDTMIRVERIEELIKQLSHVLNNHVVSN